MIAIHRSVIKIHSAAPHSNKTTPNLICVPQRDFNRSPRHSCDSILKPNIIGFGLYLFASNCEQRCSSSLKHTHNTEPEQQDTLHFRVSGQTLQNKSPQKLPMETLGLQSHGFKSTNTEHFSDISIFTSSVFLFFI